ncbi:MAG: ribonuclease Y [Deltaproteobacteria bacterium]|nr:ribonuclease Y [Deltaproteobacteria bacterium]
MIVPVASGLVLGAAGLFVGRALAKRRAVRKGEESEAKANAVLREAAVRAKEIELEAERSARKGLDDARSEIKRREERIDTREASLDRKSELLEARELEIARREKRVGEREVQVETESQRVRGVVEEARTKLERTAGLSASEAKHELIQSVADAARVEAGRNVKEIEDGARAEAEMRAKRIIGIAVQRYAGEYAMERTVAVVHLPNEEMKGRIIGREGRNIRAIEAATGVDLIIDDTPEAVVISAFNPVRREIARLSLEQLIADGRIHPTRIEEIVEKATQEVEASIREAGEAAQFELGLSGIHPEILKLVGRLKYRTSYAQNQWKHCIEVGFLAGLMAGELGLNVKMARRAGLLHDIGKAVDHEVEGPHAVIGAGLCRKFNEPPEVVHAVAAHHEDEKPDAILDHLVAAADALSGARPGARREMLESYVKRLETLEAISKSFAGVERAFAIQAGREVRVVVQPNGISDEQAVMLCRDIARKIETDVTYPGQIKVTVIRETRAVDYAK